MSVATIRNAISIVEQAMAAQPGNLISLLSKRNGIERAMEFLRKHEVTVQNTFARMKPGTEFRLYYGSSSNLADFLEGTFETLDDNYIYFETPTGSRDQMEYSETEIMSNSDAAPNFLTMDQAHIWAALESAMILQEEIPDDPDLRKVVKNLMTTYNLSKNAALVVYQLTTDLPLTTPAAMALLAKY